MHQNEKKKITIFIMSYRGGGLMILSRRRDASHHRPFQTPPELSELLNPHKKKKREITTFPKSKPVKYREGKS